MVSLEAAPYYSTISSGISVIVPWHCAAELQVVGSIPAVAAVFGCVCNVKTHVFGAC